MRNQNCPSCRLNTPVESAQQNSSHEQRNLLRALYYSKSRGLPESRKELKKFEYRFWVRGNQKNQIVCTSHITQLASLVYGEEFDLYQPAGHPKLRKQRLFQSWDECMDYARAGDIIFLNTDSECLCISTFLFF